MIGVPNGAEVQLIANKRRVGLVPISHCRCLRFFGGVEALPVSSQLASIGLVETIIYQLQRFLVCVTHNEINRQHQSG